MRNQQSAVLLIDIHLGQQQSDCQAEDHGNPQIHEVQHIQSGVGLDSGAVDIAAHIKQDACDGGTKAATQLNAQGGGGEHGAVNALAGLQVDVLRAGSNQSVQVALHGAHAQVAQGSADQLKISYQP